MEQKENEHFCEFLESPRSHISGSLSSMITAYFCDIGFDSKITLPGFITFSYLLDK